MLRRNFLITLLLTASVLIIGPKAHAFNPIKVAEGALLGPALDDAKRTADDIIEEGRGAANEAEVHAGEQMNLAITNMRLSAIATSKDINKAVIQPDQRSAVEMLNTFVATANSTTKHIDTLEEYSNLDVTDVINKFGISKQPFYISSISGTAITANDQDCKVLIRGLGLKHGIVTPLEKDDVSAVLYAEVKPDKPNKLVSLGDLKIEPSGDNSNNTVRDTISVTVPYKIIQSYFLESSVADLKIKLSSLITRKNSFAGIPLFGHTTSDNSITFGIHLLPKTPVSVVLKQYVQDESNVPDPKDTEYTWSTGDASDDHPAHWDYTYPLPNDTYIDSAVIQGDYHDNNDFFGKNIRGSRPTWTEHTVDVHEVSPVNHWNFHLFIKTHKRVLGDPHLVTSDAIPLKYNKSTGDNADFRLLPNNRSGNYSLVFTWFDKSTVTYEDGTLMGDQKSWAGKVSVIHHKTIDDAGTQQLTFMISPPT